jgi:hypothetical protein
MLTFNNKQSDVERIEIDWAEYTSTQKNIFKDNVIFFMIYGINDKNENIRLDIETILSDEKIKELETNKEIDISDYVTDVIYIINGIAYLDLSDDIENEIKIFITKTETDRFNIKVNSNVIKFVLISNFTINSK